MFRRRLLRPVRPIRPIIGRGAVAPAVPPALQRANQLMAAGDYVAAAGAFENLARGAEDRGLPQASHLFLRAGQAQILAGQVEPGMQHIKHGLSLLAENARWERLKQAGNRVVNELNEHGMSNEAREISEFLQTSLAGAPAGAAAATPGKRPVMPAHCPGCGGPVRASESEWVDDRTVECPFCGSPIRSQVDG